jgi:hypothetical protein
MKAKIITGRETVELGPDGRLQRIVVYNYTLDDLGPFEHRARVQDDTVDNLKTAIKARAEILQSATGVEF